MAFTYKLTNKSFTNDKTIPKLAKICFITSIPRPLKICSRIFYGEAKSLERQGFKVAWIAPLEQPQTLIDNIKIVGFPWARSRVHRWLRVLHILPLALREKADIYHFHDPELIPCAILLRVITHKPVIYDVHEHYPDAIRLKEWLPGWARNFMATLFDRLEIEAAPLFNAIITADDAVASRFQKVNNQLVILYNFPNTDFGQIREEFRPKRHHAAQLIYVGSNSWDRGQWLMLDVIRILVTEKDLDVGLWVVGKFDSKEKHREFVKAIESDEVLRNRVVCPGIVFQEELGPWLASADVGLVPLQPVAKFYKNIPTKMFEYMAVGLPVVGSDLPPIRRFIEESKAGLLAVPSDPYSHAEKIFSIIEHPEMAKQMGLNGRNAFLTKFNWNSEGKKMISLYRELLNLPQDRNASI